MVDADLPADMEEEWEDVVEEEEGGEVNREMMDSGFSMENALFMDVPSDEDVQEDENLNGEEESPPWIWED